MHELCPYHAAHRHLQRVAAQPSFDEPTTYPLVPDAQGCTIPKLDMIGFFRALILASGVEVDRLDEQNVPRFGGHVFRVSGAQFLSRQLIPTSTIQLLGRWTSNAIDKYLQAAPLTHLPRVAPLALHGSRPEPIAIDVEADDRPHSDVINLTEDDVGGQPEAPPPVSIRMTSYHWNWTDQCQCPHHYHPKLRSHVPEAFATMTIRTMDRCHSVKNALRAPLQRRVEFLICLALMNHRRPLAMDQNCGRCLNRGLKVSNALPAA